MRLTLNYRTWPEVERAGVVTSGRPWTDRLPCPANPNDYHAPKPPVYHRWGSEREPLGDGRIRTFVWCRFCGQSEELGICPPHKPSVAYGCPGFIRMVMCSVCSTRLADDAA